MIWAWIVTSSAVVGSSAMMSFGSHAERDRDHHALAHAAGQLVRDTLLQPLLRVGQADPLEQGGGDGPWRSCGCWRQCGVRSGSVSW